MIEMESLVAQVDFSRGERVKSWYMLGSTKQADTYTYDKQNPSIRWVDTTTDGTKISRQRQLRIVRPQGPSWVLDGPSERYLPLPSGVGREVDVYERGIHRSSTNYNPKSVITYTIIFGEDSRLSRRFRADGSLMDERRETRGKHPTIRDIESVDFGKDGKVVSGWKQKAAADGTRVVTSFEAGVTCTRSYTPGARPSNEAPEVVDGVMTARGDVGTPEVCKNKQGQIVNKPARR